MHSLSTITADMQGDVMWKKSSDTFHQNTWKIPKKKLLFSKFAGSKNEFLHTYFSRFKDFWEDCLPKLKLLLAANRLIYLNISIVISKIHGPRLPRPIDFYIAQLLLQWKLDLYLKKSWYLFHKVEHAASLHCGNNYNLYNYSR